MATFPVGGRNLLLDGVKDTDKEIGVGAYGRVFEVDYYGTTCAAKEVHSLLVHGVGPEGFQRVRDNFLRECQQCAELRHPNVVQFLGVYYKPGSPIPILVMEKMNESLRSTLEHFSEIPMSVKLSILLDVSLGLRYLHCHKPPIVHRDLSSNNILLTTFLKAKISDLGVAKVISTDRKKSFTKVPGTVDFMPPEAHGEGPVDYGTSLDVFSFGGVMLHTATQEWPTPLPVKQFDTKTRKYIALTEVQRRQKYIDKMVRVTEELKPLINSCLDDDPEARPTITSVSDTIQQMREDRQTILNMNPLSLLEQAAKEKDQLENEYEQQKTKIDQQEAEIKQLKTEITHQSAEVGRQKAKIYLQKAEIEQKKKEIDQQKAKIEWQNTEIDRQNAELNQKKLKITEIMKKLDQQKKEFNRKVEQQKKSSYQRKQENDGRKERDSIQKQLKGHGLTNPAVATGSPEFSLALQSGRYQLKWTTCSPLPNAMWWAHAAIINSTMYVGGGECPDDHNMLNVYAYDLVQNKWDILPPLQQYHGVPVSIHNKLNIIGGRDSVTPYKRTSKVTTLTDNSWGNDIVPNLLTARSWPAVVPYQSCIIVAGGCGDEGTVLDNIEVLDIALLQWRIVNTQLPKPMYTPSAAVCGKSLIIVGFGTADNKRSNETFLIDIHKIISQPQPSSSSGKDNWISLDNSPCWKTAVVASSSHPVIIGGSSEQQKTVEDITLFDDSTKNWRKVSSLPTKLAFPIATVFNNCIVVAGGCKDAKTIKTANCTCSTKVFIGHLEEIH